MIPGDTETVSATATIDAIATQRGKRLNFSDGDHGAHLAAFLDRLPQALREAPGIRWQKLPSSTLGYFCRTISKAPDFGCVALAIGSAIDGLNQNSSLNYTASLWTFLARLRETSCIETIADLEADGPWYRYVEMNDDSYVWYRRLCIYNVLVRKYLADYWRHLTPGQRSPLAAYRLPEPPPNFVEKYGNGPALAERARSRRKEQSDVLVPLSHVLVALVRLRKQAAERMCAQFRNAIGRLESSKGALSVPYDFAYDDFLAVPNRDALSLADVRIRRTPVTLRFTLWTQRQYVLRHEGGFSHNTVWEARTQRGPYRHAREAYFVEFHGPVEELLWFGDLIRDRLLASLTSCSDDERKALAAEAGSKYGYNANRPGLLVPRRELATWLTRNTRPAALLFEPEALYRGVLYGAALATIIFTNGARMSEILQVSLDRRRKRVETTTIERGGQKVQVQETIHLQHLLPKGGKTEADRKLYLMSPQAIELVGEICQELLQAHRGEIPRAKPNGHKVEQLVPERYVFQWAATPDGRLGVLYPPDVNKLMRFVLHGIDMTTMDGERISVNAHLLRHVMAATMRQEFEVPAEVVAWVLHHRPGRSAADVGGFVAGEATEYYSGMTESERQRYAMQFQLSLEAKADDALEIAVPDDVTLARMDTKLQNYFECWGTISPTFFGYCGRPGLCPRGSYRGLCIGCPHLVPNPDKIVLAEHWLGLYRSLAAQMRSAGNTRDARQQEAQAQELEGILNVMRLYKQAEEDRGFKPVFRDLPSPGHGGRQLHG